MISADTGCSAYVVGSSIAIVATGPMPGKHADQRADQRADERVQEIDRRQRDAEAKRQMVEYVHVVRFRQPWPGQIGSCSFNPITNTPTHERRQHARR